MEELSLSHIIDSESEKICYLLGQIKGSLPPSRASFEDLLKINKSVNVIMRDVIKKEMLLQFQLENISETLPKSM
jgi:hypothetical protein